MNFWQVFAFLAQNAPIFDLLFRAIGVGVTHDEIRKEIERLMIEASDRKMKEAFK